MKSLEKVRWTIATILVIIVLGLTAYRSSQDTKSKGEVCNAAGKESDAPKVRGSLPLWESLSRHLITVHR